jgi:hypothetical protein
MAKQVDLTQDALEMLILNQFGGANSTASEVRS